MKYRCLQLAKNDCGFAVLKMLLASLYHNSKFLELKPKTNKAYSMLDLKKEGEKYGLNLEGFEINKYELLTTMKYPLIALIKVKDKTHFVLLEKITKKNEYQFYDPQIGEVTLKEDDFLMVFEGHVLQVSNFEKQKIELPAKRSNASTYVLSFFNALAAVIVSMMLYFIQSPLRVVTLFGLFGGACLVLVIQQIVIKVFLKKTDNLYQTSYSNLPLVGDYQKKILEITKLPINLIVFIFSLLVIFMSSIYGYLNCLFVVSVGLVYHLYLNVLKKKSQEIEFLERMEYDFSSVRSKANGYAQRILISNILMILILGLYNIFMMHITNHIGADYFIFALSLNLLVVYCLKDLFNFEKLKLQIHTLELKLKPKDSNKD